MASYNYMMSADEVAQELNCSKSHAYKLVKAMNKELSAQGYITMAGRIPKAFWAKVIRIIDPKNVKQERKKLRRMVGLVKKGQMTRKKVDECFKAWKAHAAKGNSTKLINRMNKYYADLWKEDQKHEHDHDQKKENCERTEGKGRHAGTAGERRTCTVEMTQERTRKPCA